MLQRKNKSSRFHPEGNAVVENSLQQGCQTYSPGARTGPPKVSNPAQQMGLEYCKEEKLTFLTFHCILVSFIILLLLTKTSRTAQHNIPKQK